MLAKSLQAAAGNAAAEPIYIEDVFSTYLWQGTGSAQTITNGVDLDGEGGLVWIKGRAGTIGVDNHIWTDTVRGYNKNLYSNLDIAQTTSTNRVTSFNADGFSLGTENSVNNSSTTYAGWTFRKAEKFFDVVTYTGTGGTQVVSHNLGSVPGCLIMKATSTTGEWVVNHRSLPTGESLLLNQSYPASQGSSFLQNATSTTFEAPSYVNANGVTYVAYLFAHNAGGFGDDGEQNVISCGSFTTDSGGNFSEVNLGYEPQWLLIKNATTALGFTDWRIVDNMRGFTTSTDTYLAPNTTAAEGTAGIAKPTATGFAQDPSSNIRENTTYIYIAIRRGPMKTPEAGTEVLGLNKYSETSDYQQITTGNLVDLGWQVLNGDGYKFFTRLIGAGYLNPASAAAANTSAATKFDYMDGFAPYYANSVGAFNPREVYGFRRAPGFFDVVCYTGTGTAGLSINHNLTVVPELVIVKKRSSTGPWNTLYQPSMRVLMLNASNEFKSASLTKFYFGNDSADVSPTSSTFTVASDAEINQSSATFVSYLFASVAGVSKVGSYTGTGTTQQINCGFSSGARFVLIKRTDASASWYVWDTARGIVAGNDPYLLLNGTVAEVTNTDYIDTYSAGFEISSTAPAAINANGGSFIFLAIA